MFQFIRKNTLSLFLLVLVLTACSTPDYEAGEKVPATVTEVVDGDTVKVEMENGREETIRLLLIDTPETVHPDEPVQPYGPEASEFAKEHLPENKKVTIEVDTTIRDDYDRFLAYVWVDGDMFNRMIIDEGLARVAYVIEPNTRYVESLRETEEEVRTAEKAIWDEEDYVTDEGFNPEAMEENRSNCEDPQIKGNHSSGGDYIYHTPDGQYYEQTKAEEMFCSEDAAEKSGYRPSQQ
ncbi:nuclease [Salibacterium salarium]|uniref:Nuclease n=1 Tax=Salibacterium salarium TaxID=284579 RepID=A0A3R9P1T7_9BACI|nr:thermonuclease family protein [Salibacterium salarium]RSL29089.1 nuclease [Salibacterium salarium]